MTSRRGRKHVYAVPGGALKDILNGVNNFLKKTQLISSVASIIPHPIAQKIATGAKALGYGRRRRAPKKKVYGMGALSLAGGRVRRTRRMHRVAY